MVEDASVSEDGSDMDGSASAVASGMFMMLDADKNGRISRLEFKGLMSIMAAQGNGKNHDEAAVDESWKLIDKDGDGSLNGNEVDAYIQTVVKMQAAGVDELTDDSDDSDDTIQRLPG